MHHNVRALGTSCHTGDAASNETHYNDVICGSYGEGDPFSDFEYFEANGYPTEIRVWHGDYIDS